MAANSGDAAIVGNTVADALVVGGGNDKATSGYLSSQAVSLWGDHDFSQEREFKAAAITDLVERSLLPGMLWAEGENLDRNGDRIIQVGEANDLMIRGDLFQQLAAEFMSQATRDVSLDEIKAVADQAALALAGGETNPAEPVDGATTPENPNLMQFVGPDGYTATSANDALEQQYADFMKTPADPNSEDANERYIAESQFLASQFKNLDGNDDGSVDYRELLDSTQSSDEDVRKAATIAADHHMTELGGDSYTSFTMTDVINDGRTREPDPDTDDSGFDTDGDGEDGSESLNVLKDSDSSIEDRLKAITSLVADGTTTATITDNGVELNVRMEVVAIPGSSRTMVHMFAIDPATGKESVILRAIGDGDTFTKQRGADGQEVDFVGTRWQRNHADSMFSSSSSSEFDVG